MYDNHLESNAIGIIAAIDRELLYLKERMAITQHKKISIFDFYYGTFAGREVVLSKSDVGKVNAAVCTTLLIHTFGCRTIINTGSAAALLPEIAVGDVVISQQVMHHDVDVTAFGYALGQVPRMPIVYDADKIFTDILAQFSDINFPYRIHRGLVVAGDCFVSDTAEIKRKFLSASALDMESGAVAQTCYLFGVPFVVIRSISDNADHEASVSFNKFVEIAGQNAAILAEYLVDKIA